jgi:hypothetical protein
MGISFIPCLYDKVFESAGILGNSCGYCLDEKIEIIIIIINIWQEDEEVVKVLRKYQQFCADSFIESLHFLKGHKSKVFI